MKKKLFIIFILFLSSMFVKAQIKNEVTLLYLLPFHLNENFENVSFIRSSAEIHQVKQFEMMGFWLGAKMALREYDYSDYKINVIVRDAVTDLYSLNRILNNEDLMAPVNIIIGPFYGSLFPPAAEYAKKHGIIIVNPFSTRYDFVENNPAVYKLVSPFISRPEAFAKQFLPPFDNYNIILWGDSTITPEMLAYSYYFTENGIRFRENHTLHLPFVRTKPNLIIALFEKPERVIHAVHTLVNKEENPDLVLIVPEKWLSMSELTDEFYNLPELYFFTNVFVDENSEAVKQFQYDYTFHYEAPADIASFSYQGYDITRYFIDLFFADFDAKNVIFSPLSYKFQWNPILNGGFENKKARLIQIKGLELKEME